MKEASINAKQAGERGISAKSVKSVTAVSFRNRRNYLTLAERANRWHWPNSKAEVKDDWKKRDGIVYNSNWDLGYDANLHPHYQNEALAEWPELPTNGRQRKAEEEDGGVEKLNRAGYKSHGASRINIQVATDKQIRYWNSLPIPTFIQLIFAVSAGLLWLFTGQSRVESWKGSRGFSRLL
jgi:hypothetical protein